MRNNSAQFSPCSLLTASLSEGQEMERGIAIESQSSITGFLRMVGACVAYFEGRA